MIDKPELFIGKTIERLVPYSDDSGEQAMVYFTDGSIVSLCAYKYQLDAYLRDPVQLREWPEEFQLQVGFIDQAEYDRRQIAEKEREKAEAKEKRRAEYKKLQQEFGS